MFEWFRKSKPSKSVTVARPHPDQRIYAIGDVHGRDDLLKTLLRKLRNDAAGQIDGRKAVLVFLGDLIDRGDHSREVLDLALAEEAHWPQVVYLRGNHEAALLEFLQRPEKGASWFGYGGRQTLASYGVPVPKMKAERAELEEAAQALSHAMGAHVDFINKMTLIYRTGDVICAHSGIDPTRPLDDQDEDALLWGRSSFLTDGAPDGLRVVHGHWDSFEPVITKDRICLDTGAYYSGKLSSMRLDTETHLIQVDVFDS